MVRQHVTGICVEWSRLELTCCTMLLLLSSVLCSDIHDTPAGVQPLHAVSSRDVEASAGVTRLPHPPLNLLEGALLTGAREEFEGNQEAYEAAASWTLQRLSGTEEGSKRRNWNSRSIPHFACADNKDTAAHGATDQQRRRPSQLVEDLLSAGSVRMVSHIRAQGLSCFVATATAEQVAVLEAAGLETLGLRNFGPFPTVLKIAPGLLQIQDGPTTARDNSGTDATTTRDRDSASRRLSVIHGEVARMDNVGGLTVELSPGVLPKRDFDVADSLIADILDGLLSPSNDLHANAYWSSSRGGLSAAEDGITIGAGSYPSASALRIREWTRAANVVRSLTSSGREEGGGAVTAGDVCSWDSIRLHHPDRDSLTVTGLDHLLPSGRGAGGREGEEAEELKMACFMGLLSYLASVPEVLRVSTFHTSKILNAVAKAISQSATLTETPLTDSGLDGTGEVIQMVDSGVDTESCYFIDEDGVSVDFGHYYEEFAVLGDLSTASQTATIFANGYFPVDLDRRKIVQYISFINPNGSDYGESYTTVLGQQYPWYSESGFTTEMPGGHGSHTAGTAAGATLNTPAEVPTCDEDAGEQLGCLGECLSAEDVANLTSNDVLNTETMCVALDCDGFGIDFDSCLEDDTQEILTSHGGVAQGAKLAIFDASADNLRVFAAFAGTGLWEAAEDTGAMVHSNSWGSDTLCTVDTTSAAFDSYMYENPEHLLIFAAGNDGDTIRSVCTIGTPAIGKNVLAIGASSSGSDRWTATGEDGEARDSVADAAADIDTVAYFSSTGLTTDNRIKPELVAPGDQVLSASSGGETGPSCVLEVQAGTSMAAPVVAGAAAMIRQYFKDSAFYATDVSARGLCSSPEVVCEAFTPSAATVKAVLINSANLMGGSSEPDGSRGFGRIHLAAGLPMNGMEDVGLFVVDSANTTIAANSETSYQFNVTASDVGEFRATLTWIDPPASSFSTVQLLHDLDLTVTSPSGTVYTMWSTGSADTANVIERVIVPAEDLQAEGAGIWTVTVSSQDLVNSDSQDYSLVVTGPFGLGTTSPPTPSPSSSLPPSVASAASRRHGGGGAGAVRRHYSHHVRAVLVGAVVVVYSTMFGRVLVW